MVRVISVHNFPRQDVAAVDDVTAACVTVQDTLLLAQANQRILIKGPQGNKYLPTIEQPLQVEYSTTGNYIATLEALGDVKFVRVYLGWELADDRSTELVARIAGIVSPQSHHHEGVEMLEVPTPGMPHVIAVCQASGNLIVGCGEKISVFVYKVEQHEKSRVQFIDLFKTKWEVDLGYIPRRLSITENLIAAYSHTDLAIFTISHLQEQVDEPVPARPPEPPSGPLDYDELLINPGLIDLKTVVFPSVAAEPRTSNTAFKPSTGPPPRIIIAPSAKTEKLELRTLVRAQLTDSSTSRREDDEKFVCLRLLPCYSQDQPTHGYSSPLASPHFDQLYAVVCFFGTQQEGYLYHYLVDSQKCEVVSVYPFTAPLHDAVLEDGLVHALTDAGLETYTLRLPSETRISENDPDCLIGLRPFMNVRRLLKGNNSLYLVASQDPSATGGACTIYRLWLADSAALWADFLSTAEETRWDAPSTYSHLVREANCILKGRRERLKFTAKKNTGGFKTEEALTLVDSLYKQSCAILADHYLLFESEAEATELYRLSELKFVDVIKRIEHLRSSLPAQCDVKDVASKVVRLCREALRREDLIYQQFRGNREEFYSPHISSLVAAVLDVFEREDESNVSAVILSSPLIQQFGSDKSLHMLDQLQEPTASDCLALALLHLQKGQIERGRTLLASLDHSSLEPILLRNPHLLSEVDDSPSELSNMLLELNHKFLASVLSSATREENIAFEKVHKMLSQLLQGRGLLSKNAADVLESVIEDQLAAWPSRSLPLSVQRDAVNTLTCLYLTRLSQRRDVEPDDRVLFTECRPKYLDQLPPFGPDFNNVLSPQHSPSSSNDEPRNALIKLQALLGSEVARESVYRVRVALCQTPKVFGSLSVQVQCAAPPEAAQILVNFAPHALLAYLKEAEMDDLSLKNIIEQVQHKISSASDTKRKFYYEQLLNGVFTHIAQKMTLHAVADLLPPEHPDRSGCLRVAYNQQQAQQVRSLIMLTGAQLL